MSFETCGWTENVVGILERYFPSNILGTAVASTENKQDGNINNCTIISHTLFSLSSSRFSCFLISYGGYQIDLQGLKFWLARGKSILQRDWTLLQKIIDWIYPCFMSILILQSFEKLNLQNWLNIVIRRVCQVLFNPSFGLVRWCLTRRTLTSARCLCHQYPEIDWAIFSLQQVPSTEHQITCT